MTEEQVLAEVQALRALVEGWYSYALSEPREDLLVPAGMSNPGAIQKLQILLKEVFDSKERDVKIQVMNLVLPLINGNGEKINIGSSKELCLAEIYSWLSWLEFGDGLETLDTVTFGLEFWRERLKDQEPVTRPRVYVPVFEEEEAVPF